MFEVFTLLLTQWSALLLAHSMHQPQSRANTAAQGGREQTHIELLQSGPHGSLFDPKTGHLARNTTSPSFYLYMMIIEQNNRAV